MSDSKKGKKPLVAERRYASKPAKTAPKKPKVKKRKASTRKAPSRNIFVRLFRWVLRLIWAFTWRVTAIACIGLAVVVGYFLSLIHI